MVLTDHELHAMFGCSSWNLGMNLQAWDSPSCAFCSDLGTGAGEECPCVDFSVTGQISPSPGNSLCVFPCDTTMLEEGRALIAWIIVFILRNSTREDLRNC